MKDGFSWALHAPPEPVPTQYEPEAGHGRSFAESDEGQRGHGIWGMSRREAATGGGALSRRALNKRIAVCHDLIQDHESQRWANIIEAIQSQCLRLARADEENSQRSFAWPRDGAYHIDLASPNAAVVWCPEFREAAGGELFICKPVNLAGSIPINLRAGQRRSRGEIPKSAALLSVAGLWRC
ncbi:hypothetical protein FQA39_LY19201 [Lamprigera yunnana]|nr:hypothetical protein FQA39_LY19201 [Lamprigera yunnana]